MPYGGPTLNYSAGVTSKNITFMFRRVRHSYIPVYSTYVPAEGSSYLYSGISLVCTGRGFVILIFRYIPSILNISALVCSPFNARKSHEKFDAVVIF